MNKKQLIIELAMPVLFIALSLFVIVSAVPMGKEGFFPIMSAVVLLLCAIYLFFESAIKRCSCKAGRRESWESWNYTTNFNCVCCLDEKNRVRD